MPQKCVIVSCIPDLLPKQEAGMLQLLTNLRSKGLKVYYFGRVQYDSLNDFVFNGGSFNRLLYKYYYYKSRFFIDEAKWKARLKWWYKLPAATDEEVFFKERVKQAIKLFCAAKPDLFLCWNPNAAPHGIHANVARLMGIKAGGIEWGFLPDTYIIDQKGTLAMSEVFNQSINYPDEALVEKVGEEVYNDLENQSISLYAQQIKPLPPEVANATGTKILLIGIDTLDSAAYPEEHKDRKGLLPLHTSTYDQAVAFAQADPSFTVVFKPHPSHNQHPDDVQVQQNMWILNINPDYLIDWADVVVCTGSKMEMSVLLKNKPLITVGAGLLYKKGCSYEVNAPGELAAKVMEAKTQGLTPEQLHNFKKLLGYLKHYYLYSYGNNANNEVVLNQLIAAL